MLQIYEPCAPESPCCSIVQFSPVKSEVMRCQAVSQSRIFTVKQLSLPLKRHCRFTAATSWKTDTCFSWNH